MSKSPDEPSFTSGLPNGESSREPSRTGGAGTAARQAASNVTRGVAWSALWGIRKVRKGLRRAAAPRARPHAFRRRSPVGTPPGTLISYPDAVPPAIRAIGYGPDAFAECEAGTPDEIAGFRTQWPVLWIDVVGVDHAASIETIGRTFGLHQLALEDVMNVHQRPKVEEYPDHLFAVCRSATLKDRLDTEQLSLFVGADWVLTFQERAGDAWEAIRERLRAGRGRIRGAGAGYLFYALLDAVVDGYYPLLEDFGHRLEMLEGAVIDEPREELVGVIHAARRDVLAMRQAMWPLREAIGQLYRGDFAPIDAATRIYLRDAYDHTIQVIDLLENYREMVSALLELYLSSVSHRMNEVMKVLTVIATIFIPLTFIAGIYGMNFDPDASPLNMPELDWYWGYPAVWMVMVAVALGLLWYFKRKRWF